MSFRINKRMKNFNQLSQQIATIDVALKSEAAKAVNRLLTIRNWFVGYYLVTYEQEGEDRAEYGSKLLERLANSPELKKVKGMTRAELSRYRQFYLTYPKIIQTLSEFSDLAILGTASQELESVDHLPLLGTASQDSKTNSLPPDTLVSKLSFSHFIELIKLRTDEHRAFYEKECIQGTWSVRELKRQIASLLYERTGLSKDKSGLTTEVQNRASQSTVHDLLRTPYVFEFLGLPEKALVKENDLEQAIMDHLTDFILELGNGFCFEARQKRILIGDEYFFIDLVFYHRILKCHVIIELKVDTFNHAHAAQLNTYLNYVKAEISQPEDNPPVGILLCTGQNEALVKYATAGMDQKLFVQQYQVLLPSEADLKAFIDKETDQLKSERTDI